MAGREFMDELQDFLTLHKVTIKDFDRFFQHLTDVLGVESMEDLVELKDEDLTEDKIGTCSLYKLTGALVQF